MGDFVTASVLDCTIGNISESFGINCDGCSNLSKIIEHLERKKESRLLDAKISLSTMLFSTIGLRRNSLKIKKKLKI